MPQILETFQQSVVDEAEALCGRIDRMEVFGQTPAFEQLSKQERFRLSTQLGLMRLYLYILNERIYHFRNRNDESLEG